MQYPADTISKRSGDVNILKRSFLSLAGVAAFVSSLLPLNPAKAVDTGLNLTKSASFALQLFNRETKGATKNVLVSPFSAYIALSMAANGADGATLSGMAKTLGFSQEDLNAINARNASVIKALNENKNVQMEIANALYADKAERFKDEFINLCKQKYDAEANTEDFGDPSTLGKINGWCDKKTHGKITEILTKLSPSDKMVLLNSVYFKGTWASQFDKKSTKPQPFFLLSGQPKDVAMMHRSGKMRYLQGDGFQSVCLPYAGEKQAMYIFLPEKTADFASFVRRFTAENWQKWVTGFSQQRVDLSMPRYKVECSMTLNKALIDMGMQSAFSSSANFKNLFVNGSGYISSVLQKTYMDVNEEGTEAAAVTAVVMTMAYTAARPVPPVEFVVDHPFVVALVDEQSREILFLGTIVDPPSSQK
jgi:serine protease inhibitor